MKVDLTYIFHNCFLLHLYELTKDGHKLTFLFDYPADRFLKNNLKSHIRSKISDTNLYILSSHSHEDHFNPGLTDFLSSNPNTRIILSHDIIEANPEKYKAMDPEKTVQDPLLIVGPDQSYSLPDFSLTTFRSNDLGVAFLIDVNDYKIYFGGDLADWDWEDELEPEERKEIKEIYQSAIDKLKIEDLDIAFINTDQRLKNWSGAMEFLAEIKPEIFVPMHTFGRTESLDRFFSEYRGPLKKVFHYRTPGDSISFSLDSDSI